ncbi:MAG: sensor histidine kinase [Runella sp.]
MRPIVYLLLKGLLVWFTPRLCEAQHLQPTPDKLAVAQKMLKEATIQQDSVLLAKAYYQYGKAYNTVGNHLTAHRYYSKARSILDKRGDSYELGQVYMRLSDLECEQDHCEKCLEHARTGLGIFRRIGSEKGIMIAYGCLNNGFGKIWTTRYHSDRRHPLWDSLWRYARATEQLAYKLKDTLGIAEITLSMGNLYALDKNRQALRYIQKAKVVFELKKRIFELSSTYVTLANCFMNFGEWQNAYQSLRSGEQVYRQIPHESLMDRNFYQAYLRYYKTTHQPQKALEYSEKLRTLEAQILLSDQKGAISRLNVQYENQKKETLIKTQQKELQVRAENERKQRVLLGIGAVLLVVVSVVGSGFWRLSQKNHRISLRNEWLVKEQNHRVKNNLQIVSSLLNIQARSFVGDTPHIALQEAKLRIESMTTLHRKLYKGNTIGYINLKEFITEIIENIEGSYGQRVEKHLSIEPIEVEADKATLLGLILTEVFTNAWKHAFSLVSDPVLFMKVHRIGTKIHLGVADNGPGWNGDADGHSLGAKLIKAHAAQLRAQYSFSAQQGTIFTIEFNT